MKDAKKQGFTHDNVKNKSIEWYTPKWIFDKLDLVFDLDPCAPAGGVPWIPAKNHYSLIDDGLTSSWGDKNNLIWLNPPYGVSTGAWLKKMHEHRNGIALVFARTDCAWFHDYVAKADAILFLKGRVRFVDALGVTKGSGAGSGSMLIAWGDLSIKALEDMKDYGHLVYA
jgi:phage N-6-adenine-methyltransferase